MKMRLARTRALVPATLAAGLVLGLVLGFAPGFVPGFVAAPLPAAAAAPCATTPGDHALPVTFGGRTYRVQTHVPPTFAKTRALVINLHGATQSGPMHRDSTGMNASSDEHGYAVAYPTGGYLDLPAELPAGNFWNVAGLPLLRLPVPPVARDDVAFVLAVATQLSDRLCGDRRRIYATGASNGGIMASYLACHHAEVFAAVAPVMGVRAGRATGADFQSIDAEDCRPSRPIAVLALHGAQDPILPYAGQPGGGPWGPAWGYPVEAALARWAQLDGCAPIPTASVVTSTISRRTWSGCRGGVRVEALVSSTAGHSWWGHPTPPPFNLFAGPDDLSADANELIWSFLSRYRLPAESSSPTARRT